MIRSIYWCFRQVRYTSPVVLGNVTLNGGYYPSSKLSNQFGDWGKAGFTKIVDTEIPEDRYTGTLPDGTRKLTQFMRCEYDDQATDPAEFARSVTNVGAEFNIEILPVEDARQWLRDNTDLVEESPGKFLVREAYKDITGKDVPALYLTVA